jgi:hypothetical protein
VIRLFDYVYIFSGKIAPDSGSVHRRETHEYSAIDQNQLDNILLPAASKVKVGARSVSTRVYALHQWAIDTLPAGFVDIDIGQVHESESVLMPMYCERMCFAKIKTYTAVLSLASFTGLILNINPK